MSNFAKANLYFLLVAALWGATFPIIKNSVSQIDPNLFVALRFLLAGIVLLPAILRGLKKSSLKLVYAGLILGVLNSIAYCSQTIGLQYISSARSAFITGLNVVFVPLLGFLFRVGKLTVMELIGAIISLIGLFVLTGSNVSHLSFGDLVTLICAVAVALSILYMQHVSTNTNEFSLITFYQIMLTCPLPFMIYATEKKVMPHFSLGVVGAILFCAVLATVVPMFLQAKYQKHTSATMTALIFSLEPIFAAVFSIIFYHEDINQSVVVGGLIMLFGSMVPILSFLKNGVQIKKELSL